MRRKNQFERTDRDITNAVLEVMETKSFEKITVQDILEEAKVNRTTFYQHFPDKYAVLEKLQERYINGMTRCIDEELNANHSNIEKISAVLYEYMTRHRQKMRKLITVRAEGLDMEKQMRIVFVKYIRQYETTLSELEEEILSGMMVQFIVYLLKNDIDAGKFAEMMLDVFLNISLIFFRVDHVPDARKRLLELIGSMHTHDKKN